MVFIAVQYGVNHNITLTAMGQRITTTKNDRSPEFFNEIFILYDAYLKYDLGLYLIVWTHDLKNTAFGPKLDEMED